MMIQCLPNDSLLSTSLNVEFIFIRIDNESKYWTLLYIQCNIIAFFIIDFIVTKPWKELLNSPNYIFHTSFIREQWKEPFHLLILECMECQSTLFVLIITQDDHDFFMTSTSLSLSFCSRKHEKYQMSLKRKLEILPCSISFPTAVELHFHAIMPTWRR